MTDASRATAQLIQFIATEVQGCAKNISMAMAEYAATGNLPPSMFEEAAPATKRQKRKDKGQKRKPSAFNMFVSEKMAKIRNGASDEDEVVAKGAKPVPMACWFECIATAISAVHSLPFTMLSQEHLWRYFLHSLTHASGCP